MGVQVELYYNYSGDFAASPESQARCASWYNDGVEIIFACGGAVGNSVMKAAEASTDKYVIGVDVDQSNLSTTVVNSAMKDLKGQTYKLLEAYYNGSFPGGESILADATTDGVSLAMSSNKFKTFNQEMYDELFGKLKSGEIKVLTDTDVTAPTEIPVTNVTLNYVQ